MKKLYQLFLFILFTLSFSSLSAQCTYNNAAYLDLTPTGVGNTQTSVCTWAGDYNTVTVCNGAQYTIATCGSSYATRITIYDATGTTVLAWQDSDNCSGQDETMTYTATFNGVIHILLDRDNCGHNTTCGTMSVTQNTACGGGGGPGDDCANADRIDCGDPVLVGETTIGNSDTENNWSCLNPIATPGEDHFYVVQWTDAAAGGTIRLNFTNVSDANDTYMEVVGLGSSCSPNTCTTSSQMTIATGLFGTSTNFFEFDVGPGVTDYYFVVDSQNDGIDSYDLEVTCFTTGLELDVTNSCAPIPGGEPANQGFYQTWDGAAPPATADPPSMTGTYTICENIYIKNVGWEWLKYFDITLGACWINPTNFTPNANNTGFHSLGHASCASNPGGLSGHWSASLAGNVISWSYLHPWRRNPPCVDVTAWGDGNLLGNNYTCALYTFCYDADVDPACSALTGFQNGVSATDDGIGGGGGGAINPSNITLGSTSPTVLPVNLISFTAEPVLNNDKYGVVLKWKTVSEKNNDYFTVERSKDGKNFSEVLRMKGAGNSNDINSYVAVDEAPYRGISYYRLRQTDYNGAFEYFNIEAVNLTKIKDVELYPNPVKSELNLSFTSLSESSNVNLTIFDSKGSLVYNKDYLATKGLNNLTTNIKDFPEGLYFIILDNDE